MPELRRDHEGQAVPLHGVIPTEPPPPNDGWPLYFAIVMFVFFAGIVIHQLRQK